MESPEVHQEMEHARAAFHDLIRDASRESLRRRSAGTRWTNRQLLFHMVFGYLIVRTLMPLVHALGRLGWSRRFATSLNVTHRPFHVINYLGSCDSSSPRRRRSRCWIARSTACTASWPLRTSPPLVSP